MARRRRASRMLDELPGLFDSVDFDVPVSEQFFKGHEVEPEPATAEEKAESPAAIAPLRKENVKTTSKLRYISFGSGSSGNCAYVGDDSCGFLIDAGVDNNTVTNELKRNGIDLKNVRGIILTHDHSDHVRFAYSLLRRNPHMLLYCTPRNLNGLLRRHNISRRIKDYHKPIYKEIGFEIGNFTLTAFDVTHDGTDNMGFDIALEDRHFVVATDMGAIGERADYYIRQARYLMLESNYDLQMLMEGRYPEYLKARIISERGHLDNADVADYLKRTWSPGLTHVFLCHLSNDNNKPEIALESARRALESHGITVGDGSGSIESRQAPVQLVALPRFESSALFVLR